VVRSPHGGFEGTLIDAVAKPALAHEVAHRLGRFAPEVGAPGGREPGDVWGQHQAATGRLTPEEAAAEAERRANRYYRV
jgi:hypothetical protein